MTQATIKNRIGRPAGSGAFSKRVTLYFSETELASVNKIILEQNARNQDKGSDMSKAIRFALNKTADELSEQGSSK